MKANSDVLLWWRCCVCMRRGVESIRITVREFSSALSLGPRHPAAWRMCKGNAVYFCLLTKLTIFLSNLYASIIISHPFYTFNHIHVYSPHAIRTLTSNSMNERKRKTHTHVHAAKRTHPRECMRGCGYMQSRVRENKHLSLFLLRCSCSYFRCCWCSCVCL